MKVGRPLVEYKTLWICGDSFATFDKTNPVHWAKQLAEYYKCDRIFNLARGGFSNHAISYTAIEVLDNRLWPGKTDEQEFDFRRDIMLLYGTTPERFCRLRNPNKKFEPNISIANLNWWVKSLVELDNKGDIIGCQEPMPWIEHMPRDSNLYCQNYNSVLNSDYCVDDDIGEFTDEFLHHDWMWAHEVEHLLIDGVKHFFNNKKQQFTQENPNEECKAMLFTTNYRRNYDTGEQLKFKLPGYDELIETDLISREYHESKDRTERELCNHLIPEEHDLVWSVIHKHLLDNNL